MHSSRMLTDRLLTVCLPLQQGVGVHPCCNVGRGVIQGGASMLHPGCILSPVDRMSDTCENTTFAALLPSAVGKNTNIANL